MRFFLNFLRIVPCSFALALGGCNTSPTPNPAANSLQTSANTTDTQNQERPIFEEVAAASGLSFKHSTGSTGRYYFIENTPPGCALFDFDNDQDLDIFLVQSGPTGATPTEARPPSKLFRNEGRRNGQSIFVEVSVGSGLDKDLGYAHGAAVADYDNDGYEDLFITSYPSNFLFRNERGTGRWKDVTAAMKLNNGAGYSSSAAWGDYDNDGLLDLYVCYYTKWSWEKDVPCVEKDGGRDYCSPLIYDPVSHRLYRNRGDRFEDITRRSGIEGTKGRGLAVSWFDFNGDGRQDIFVANDLTHNMLWRNDGGGKFTDVAVQAGVAMGDDGRKMAGMGIAIGDYNRSGRASLFVTNFSERPNVLFRNVGGGAFEDATDSAGLGLLHLKFLSFGCEFLDYDRDGWSDLITNNGHVNALAAHRQPGVGYAQAKQLLKNEEGRFKEITDKTALGELATPRIGRGLATGDYDNDGRVDILAMNQNAAAQLFRNQSPDENRWVSFLTMGKKSNRSGLHTRFEIRAGGVRQVETVRAGSSYLSSSDRRVYFGVGKAGRIDEVKVQWPSGTREVFKNLDVDTFYTLEEGRGIISRRKPVAL